MYCKMTASPLIKGDLGFSARLLSVVIKIGQDNGLHPTLSEQQCTEHEDLRNIFLSNIAVNFTIANL